MEAIREPIAVNGKNRVSIDEYLAFERDSQRNEEINVEVFRLNKANHWELDEYKVADQHLFIPSLDLSLSLRDIYEDTRLLDSLK
jgi:Uma2 family endonuclease